MTIRDSFEEKTHDLGHGWKVTHLKQGDAFTQSYAEHMKFEGPTGQKINLSNSQVKLLRTLMK